MKEAQLDEKAAPKGAGRMGAEKTRVNRLHQQATQVGKAQQNQIHRTNRRHERVS